MASNPGITLEQAKDIINTTLRNIGDDDLEVMFDNQFNPFSAVFNSSRRKQLSGPRIERTVMLNRKGQARYRGLFDSDNPTIDEVLHKINVPWAHIDTSYSWHLNEIAANANAGSNRRTQIHDLVRTRRTERLWDMGEEFELRGWRAPDSATDEINPFGIPYYGSLRDDGDSGAGFDGTNIRFNDGTKSSVVAGLDASAEPKWRNYAATYTDNDLVGGSMGDPQVFLRTLRKAVRRTHFTPNPFAETQGVRSPQGSNDSIAFYGGVDLITKMEDLGDRRDDNNQPRDLANVSLQRSDNGTIFFNRRPVLHSPPLDDFTVVDGTGADFNPQVLYCVDWSKFIPATLRWMVQSEPIRSADNHNVLTVYVDASHQLLCLSRRTGVFAVHLAVPAA